MLARSVRSGLTETYHDGGVAGGDRHGSDIPSTGDTARPVDPR